MRPAWFALGFLAGIAAVGMADALLWLRDMREDDGKFVESWSKYVYEPSDHAVEWDVSDFPVAHSPGGDPDCPECARAIARLEMAVAT